MEGKSILIKFWFGMADFERFVAATSRYRGRRGVAGTDDLDGKRLRRTQIVRRTIDIVSDIMVDKHQQRTRLNAHDVPSPYPSYQWHRDMLPLTSYRENPATCFTTKYVHTSVNKVRHSTSQVNRSKWYNRVLKASLLNCLMEMVDFG